MEIKLYDLAEEEIKNHRKWLKPLKKIERFLVAHGLNRGL